MLLIRRFGSTAAFLLMPAFSAAGDKPRARDLGIPFDGTPGPLNASQLCPQFPKQIELR